MRQTAADSQAFRAAASAIMEHSKVMASPPTGGLLHRPLQLMAFYTCYLAMIYTGSTPRAGTVFRCVA